MSRKQGLRHRKSESTLWVDLTEYIHLQEKVTELSLTKISVGASHLATNAMKKAMGAISADPHRYGAIAIAQVEVTGIVALDSPAVACVIPASETDVRKAVFIHFLDEGLNSLHASVEPVEVCYNINKRFRTQASSRNLMEGGWYTSYWKFCDLEIPGLLNKAKSPDTLLLLTVEFSKTKDSKVIFSKVLSLSNKLSYGVSKGKSSWKVEVSIPLAADSSNDVVEFADTWLLNRSEGTLDEREQQATVTSVRDPSIREPVQRTLTPQASKDAISRINNYADHLIRKGYLVGARALVGFRDPSS